MESFFQAIEHYPWTAFFVFCAVYFVVDRASFIRIKKERITNGKASETGSGVAGAER
jgi:hypothetical protein